MAWPQLRKVSIWQTASAMALELEQRGVKVDDGGERASGGEEMHCVTKRPVVRDPREPERMTAEDDDAKGATARAVVTPSYAASPSPAADDKEPAQEGAPEVDRPKGDQAAADAKPAAEVSPEEAKAARDRRIEELLRAQPKKQGLGGLSPLGSKVNAPHRVPANEKLNEKLAKMRAELGGVGQEAPWDEFGRPRALSFKK